jgi:hypothetical protein
MQLYKPTTPDIICNTGGKMESELSVPNIDDKNSKAEEKNNDNTPKVISNKNTNIINNNIDDNQNPFLLTDCVISYVFIVY